MNHEEKKKKKRQEKLDKIRQHKMETSSVNPMLKKAKFEFGRMQLAVIFVLVALALGFIFYTLSNQP